MGTRSVGSAEPGTARVLPTFDESIDVTDVVVTRRRLRRQLVIMRTVALMLLLAAICVVGYPLTLQYFSARHLSQISGDTARSVAGWPYPQAKNALTAARAYNRRLAASGQPILGEAADPFSAVQGGSKAKGEDSVAAKDKEYQSLLDAGGGVMGAIRIPEISVDLPIYHGTSEEALAAGSGHLYGTSLPVGGTGTHAVITGHRGLVNAMMFTRLDEIGKGDYFYIEVMGETLGYKVDRISVILPDDTSQLTIKPGEDRVTLMTCTPYGINTHRLLVSGHRVKIPVPAPEPGDLYDTRMMVTMTVVCALAGGWLLVGVAGRMRHGSWRPMRHAAFWPRALRG